MIIFVRDDLGGVHVGTSQASQLPASCESLGCGW